MSESPHELVKDTCASDAVEAFLAGRLRPSVARYRRRNHLEGNCNVVAGAYWVG